jgi:hypothetical protein
MLKKFNHTSISYTSKATHYTKSPQLLCMTLLSGILPLTFTRCGLTFHPSRTDRFIFTLSHSSHSPAAV